MAICETVVDVNGPPPRHGEDGHGLTGLHQACGDRRNLLRSLAGAEDHFRKALPDASVVIDPREPKVFERCLAYARANS